MLLLAAGVFVACFAGLTWRYLGSYTVLLILAFPLIDALIDKFRQYRMREEDTDAQGKGEKHQD